MERQQARAEGGCRRGPVRDGAQGHRRPAAGGAREPAAAHRAPGSGPARRDAARVARRQAAGRVSGDRARARRGFIFGDGVYEVIPVYSRRPFRLEEHLARLQASLDGIRLANPHPLPKWAELVVKIIAGNPWEDQTVYLQVTRGAAKRDHAFPKGLKPTVFLMASELVTPSAELLENGAKAIVLPDFRWLRCDIKSTSLLGNCMLRTLAADQGCVEAILVRDGQLTEASASNVFIVKNGTVLAPPKSHLILPGITYDV